MFESRALSFLFPNDAQRVRRRDRVIAIVCAVLALVLVLRAARKEGGVLVTNQQFGARFLAHEDPYFDTHTQAFVHRPYPPSYAWITAPLSLLPTTFARVIWTSGQIGALAAMFVVLRRWTKEYWPALAAHASVLFALAVLLASRYLLRDTAGGGGNTLYVASALCAVDLALRGRDAKAGFFLALPLVLKPALAPVALGFARRGERRALAWTIAFVVLLFWTPALWFGGRAYAELAQRWRTDVVQTARVEATERAQMPDLADGMNQSLRGAVARGIESTEAPYADRAGGVALALGLVLAGVACWNLWRAPRGRAQVLATLALLPLALLVSPISWKAHHVALLPVFFALLCEALDSPRRRELLLALCAYYVVCVLASGEVVGRVWKARLEAASIVTLGDLVLLALVWLACRRAARAA